MQFGVIMITLNLLKSAIQKELLKETMDPAACLLLA